MFKRRTSCSAPLDGQLPFKRTVFPKFQHMDDGPKSYPRTRPTFTSKPTCSGQVSEAPVRIDDSGLLISDKYSVEGVDQLVVRKDRISEVRKWLEDPCSSRYPLRVLLLTGPSGSGKATTLKVLCKELDYSLVTYESNQTVDFFYSPSGELMIGDRNQVDEFCAFIRSAGRRCLGQPVHVQKVLLIREIPNVFVKAPNKLLHCLDQLKHSCRCVLVFSLTQIETCWDLNPNKYFTPALNAALHVTRLKFNPITKADLAKAVRKWAALIGFAVPGPVLSAIKEKANGDLSSAMCMLEVARLNARTGSLLLHGCDLKTELGHFVGRLVYAKRAEDPPTTQRLVTEQRVPATCSRPIPPKYDLGTLLEESPCTSGVLVDFVSEHKVQFVVRLADAARVYDDLSLAQTWSREFGEHNTMDIFANELVVTSSFYHSNGEFKNRGFYGFTKPATKAQRDKCRFLSAEVNRLFPTGSFTETVTSLIPLKNHIKQCISSDESSLFDQIVIRRR